MDNRDKQLIRHMKSRMAQAKNLPIEKQCRWAEKCIDLAQRQHRTIFYLMARNWLSDIHAVSV